MKVYLLFLFFSFLFLVGNLKAQDSGFNLDEFETGLSGAVGAEKQKEQEEIKKNSSEKSQSTLPEDGEFERIQVTGSHIKRIDIEGASPIQVLDKAVLERSGYNSVSDVLRDMSANSFGSAREASGSSAAGASSVSLRGLGANKTLVLLNGKRLPSDAVTGAVDLNMIPMAAVARIEILKDGASATYGSDALGGVVNIITHKDFLGSQISGQKSFNKFVGGETSELNLVSGSSTSRSSMVTVVTYRNNTGIFSRDRSWSDTGVSTTGSPGSFRDNSGVYKPDPKCPAAQVMSTGGGNNVCTYNFAKDATEMPWLKQLSAMTLFEYETESQITLFGRASATRKLVNWAYAPAPGTFSIPAATAATLGIAGYSGGNVTARYRTVELGNRESDIETTGLGYQLGAKGAVTSTWDWEFSYDNNRVRNVDIGVSGYALKTKIETLISDGDFNPFANAGSRGDLSSAEYEPWKSSVSENNMMELKVSGEAMETKNGAVGAAVGVVMSKESFSDSVDKLSESGEVFGGAGSSGGGSRETKSAYFEVVAPLLKSMELQIAGRYDSFSDFGDTSNPKIGLKWNVSKKLMFRASAGTGFKAPTLNDMYAAESFGYPTFVDAVACEAERTATPNDTPSCDPQQWLVKSGGNSGLKEETSTSFNIGTVYQATDKTNFGLDYWVTKLDNVVGVDYGKLTQAEQNGINLSQYGVTVTRTGGYIDQINAPLLNLSKQEVSGLDFRADHKINNNISTSFEHSIVLYFREEGFPGTGFDDILESNGRPAWRNNINITFEKEKHSLSTTFKTIGPHSKAVAEEGELKKYTEVDVAYNYDLTTSSSFTIGVNNLFGSTPPLDDSNINSKLDSSLYSPRGPMAYVGYKQNF